MDMDCPQKKLGSVDGGKTPPLLLAAQLAKKAIAASPFPDAHRMASAWAFVTAWFFPVSIVLGSAIDLLLCSQLLWCLLEREGGTPIDSALWIALWCCPALQAVVAALALLLPSRHRRIRRLGRHRRPFFDGQPHPPLCRCPSRDRARIPPAHRLVRLRRGGAGAAAPVPPPPDPPCPRLPRGRHRRPLCFGQLGPPRRHKTPHLLDRLLGDNLHPGGGRPPQLPGPPPGR
ncbi:uncharacterized protein LOC119311302 [Triticum dicoccoides]|uniref:uncharacterized protein LOC119311302 n=1 Tax=Triticum dicoccoides TaxID=85692 RepID=UPI000E78B80E|nr:uncharacterized protein LOC119311302 [Triticum dicoccoides]